jgi:hypothetical protein
LIQDEGDLERRMREQPESPKQKIRKQKAVRTPVPKAKDYCNPEGFAISNIKEAQGRNAGRPHPFFNRFSGYQSAASFLARLSNEDFSAGIARLHAYGHGANQNDAVTEEIDWFVFTKHV